jgi:hypothetical protein
MTMRPLTPEQRQLGLPAPGGAVTHTPIIAPERLTIPDEPPPVPILRQIIADSAELRALEAESQWREEAAAARFDAAWNTALGVLAVAALAALLGAWWWPR